MFLFRILDCTCGKCSYFFAESVEVAKRQYLLGCCQSPFWSDFKLQLLGVEVSDQISDFSRSEVDFEMNFDDVLLKEIPVSQDEVDSFVKQLERHKALIAGVHNKEVKKDA